MERKLNNILLLVFVGILSSCSLNKGSNESVDYSESEGLYSKKIKQFGFVLKPFDSNTLMNINYGDDINVFPSETRDSIINEYKDYSCFIFEINIEGFTGDIADYEIPGKQTDYDQRVNYYLFGMQNDIQLTDKSGKQIACTIYYYERLNEIAKTNRFIVGFKTQKSDDVIFEYNNPYFNCGKINFSINNQHLASN